MLATWKVKSQSYDFEPGPRYRVTDMKGLQKVVIQFTEIGTNGKLIDSRVKEKTLRSWDVPTLNQMFAIAKDLRDGKYGQGGRAGSILKTMIEKEITRKKGAPTHQAKAAERHRERSPPPSQPTLPPRRPAAPAPAPAPAPSKRKAVTQKKKPAAKKKKPAAKKPAAKAPSKPSSTKRPAPSQQQSGREAPRMRREERDPYLDDHAGRRITYAELYDRFGDDYDETDYEHHELTDEQTNMTYADLMTLFKYMDGQGRVFCKEAGDGHCALAGPERMRLWCAGELKSAWQPLNHNDENELEKKDDWYVPVRQFLADSLQEDSVMFKSIYENVKMLTGNGIVDDTLDAHQLYDDLKRISPSVASEEAMRDKAEFEYFCSAWELMALVGRAPGRIFVLESELTDDIYCFEKDLDGNDEWNGGVNVRRELKLSDLVLDATDTFLLYNGEDHYDSFVPYEGVVMGEEEEA